MRMREKSVPRDNRLSSLGKPRYSNQGSSGRIFLSHPHIIDSYNLIAKSHKTDLHILGKLRMENPSNRYRNIVHVSIVFTEF